MECETDLDKERLSGDALRRELQHKEESQQRTDAQYRLKLRDLKDSLEAEKTRNDELNRYRPG